jgi:CheY-like chemotaxis protein
VTPQPIKPHVLIVDDHAANRVAFGALLQDDYTVSLAASGKEALEVAGRQDFAVILLDVRMPVMDGFETAAQLRQREARYTPIVFISAYDQNDLHLKRGYVAGATDFIFSPVDEDLLKFKVATYVQIFLRHESLLIRVQQLTNLIHLLQVEVSKRGPSEDALKGRIHELELAVEDLRTQLLALPV